MPDLLEPADPRGRDRTLTSLAAVERTRVTAIHKESRADSGQPVLLFDHVSKWYGPVIGVNQVTLELRPGITGLVGANGAGKSTLLRLATGQLRPDLGAVRVQGIDAWSAAAKRHVGYSPESDAFYEEMSGAPSSKRWRGFAVILCKKAYAARAVRSKRSAWPAAQSGASAATPRGCGSESSSPRPWSTIPIC